MKENDMKESINRINNDIIEKSNDDLDARSWWLKEGILLSVREANYLLEKNKTLKERINKLEEKYDRLREGRNYLMEVEPKNLNVEDALEAFGFNRNGF